MPNTHDLGRLFWHSQRYPRHVPYRPVEKGTTGEIEPPYRTAKSVVFRVGWRGFALGWWSTPTHDPDSVPPGMEILGDKTEEVREWDGPSGFRICDDEHNCEPYGEHWREAL